MCVTKHALDCPFKSTYWRKYEGQNMIVHDRGKQALSLISATSIQEHSPPKTTTPITNQIFGDICFACLESRVAEPSRERESPSSSRASLVTFFTHQKFSKFNQLNIEDVESLLQRFKFKEKSRRHHDARKNVAFDLLELTYTSVIILHGQVDPKH